MTDRVARIDARRTAMGLSIEQLARLADVSERSVRRALRERSPVSEATLTALEQALIWAKRGTGGLSPIRVAYRMALYLMAGDFGVSMADLDAEDAAPQRKATNNPVWMRAATIRRRAVYCLNTVFGFPQHELVAVSGLTPAGVSRICREIEDERDEDPALDERFTELSRELMGGL
ncbi:helix-turn-helix domain-containing protein [Pleomorphomonas koreensis]|uniref:helix-turn-helix domain-containing protein n=1 Tax=Pleomorphomonas koreensis TaxID=257440 RepID=UPI000406F194|nr:helix-turn-helix domain-containing protein [Pleomorphomonas koreensis]